MKVRKLILCLTIFLISWSLFGQENPILVSFHTGSGISSYHSQEVTYPLQYKPVFYAGFSISSRKFWGYRVDVSYENKGAKKKENNWVYNTDYLTLKGMFQVNAEQAKTRVALGMYAGALVRKKIQSDNELQAAYVKQFYKNADLGLSFSGVRGIYSTDKVDIGLEFSCNYSLISIYENGPYYISSFYSNWDRNIFFGIGINIGLKNL